jgi:hypothetical protein
MQAVYSRIFVVAGQIVRVELPDAAIRHGMMITLPEVGMARPTGVGRAITTYEIPIEGRDEWLEAAKAAERPA